MRRYFQQTWLLLVILLALGFFTRFLFIWHPAETVFDEVYFGSFAQSYFTHEYYFDIHPPLGKLLLAGTAFTFGYKPDLTFETIGTKFTNHTYIYLRLLPVLLGSLLPLLLFLVAKALDASKLASFFAGLAALLDNGLLVDAHFIFIDGFIPVFGFAGLCFLLYWRKNRRIVSFVLACIFLSLTACVKWSGLAYPAIGALIILWDTIARWKDESYATLKFLARGASFIAIFALLYITQFWVHFALLTKSGPGNAYMSPGFQKTLENNAYQTDSSTQPIEFLKKFVELQEVMYTSQESLTGKHPYASRPQSWPLMERPIYYWNEPDPVDQSKTIARIYFMGNPFVWWIAFQIFILSVVFLVFEFLPFTKKEFASLEPTHPWFYEKRAILYVGWILTYIPFFLIPRDLFLYHYVSALLFSIVVMSIFLFDYIPLLQAPKRRVFAFSLLVGIFIVGFIFIAPLSYGLNLNDAEYNSRVWFQSWI